MTLIDSLITAYGFLSIASIIAIAGVVWLISHFVAKPGGKVSVLWGLAIYDRRDARVVHKHFKEDTSQSSVTHIVGNGNSKIAPDANKNVVIARLDDSLLMDTETQRASSDVIIYRQGIALTQLAIVTLVLEAQGSAPIPAINLHLKRKRPGEILSVLPQILGDVEFQSSVSLTQLGIQITLKNMHPRERFRLQMLTDGLRATDFHLVLEPRIGTVDLMVEKCEDWQP